MRLRQIHVLLFLKDFGMTDEDQIPHSAEGFKATVLCSSSTQYTALFIHLQKMKIFRHIQIHMAKPSQNIYAKHINMLL